MFLLKRSVYNFANSLCMCVYIYIYIYTHYMYFSPLYIAHHSVMGVCGICIGNMFYHYAIDISQLVWNRPFHEDSIGDYIEALQIVLL